MVVQNLKRGLAGFIFRLKSIKTSHKILVMCIVGLLVTLLVNSRSTG